MGNLRNQFLYSVRPGTTKLMGYVAVGTGGAIATDSTTSTPGFTVTRASKGQWTVTLDEKYLGLVGFQAGCKKAAYTSEGYMAHVTAEAVSSTKTMTLRIDDAYGQYEDPINCVMYLELTLKTSEQG